VKAVILVGGMGTRLRPLTLTTPKQMLPVAGRPMIERVVTHLAGHGVDAAVLSLGYRPDAFIAAYPDNRCAGISLVYAVEPEPLDTAGAIAFAARRAGIDGTFVAVNGDVLSQIDLSELVAVHRRRGGLATIALTPVDDPSRYGVVCTDADDRVTAFIEKPPADKAPTNLINAGTYVLQAEVLDRVDADRRVSIERETFPTLVDEGGLFAVASDADWIDAGTPTAYLEASSGWAKREGGGIAASADVDASARVVGSVIEAGATIGPNAVVDGSVVLPDARVGPATTVSRSIVGRRAVIGAGARVEGLSVLGDGAIVAPGETLVGVRRPEVAL
jgi:mannose-1-phosphate guanylyltransferase